MKNIIIYLREGMLSPRGGKLGYNYHLKQQLDTLGVTNIHYIAGTSVKYEMSKNVNQLKNSWYKHVLIIIKSVISKFLTLYGFRHKAIVPLNQYDIVHFHSTLDMFNAKDSLKSYKGKVVLTSHTPTIQSKEMYDQLTQWEKKHMNWFYKNLIKIDEYAFNRADNIIFPCPEAEEPYFNNWKQYASIKESKKDCYRYLLSGTEKRIAKRSKEEVCKKYNIPRDAFIISYAGRHNEIKGYDILKDIGKNILDKHPNVYFLIAGKEEPISGLTEDRWIEVGWTTDPHSLIAASDIFILPNRETYFDLIMLEVLSLGTPILASDTGGNKHFKQYKNCGIYSYENTDEAERIIEKTMNLDEKEKNEIKRKNINLFETIFSLDIFAKNYIELINNI